MNTWQYSTCRGRLVRDGCGGRVRLVERIKPRWLSRMRRPWACRVERYERREVDRDDDILVKYTTRCDERIERELEAVKRLKKTEIVRNSAVLLPEPVFVQGGRIRGRGLVTPWQAGGTLWHVLTQSLVSHERIATLLCRSTRVLRGLHSIAAQPSAAEREAGERRLAESLSPNAGDACAAQAAAPILGSVLRDRLKEECGASWCWTHGDCFAYQCLLADFTLSQVRLCDWESARVDRTGLYDAAQLWASLELAIAMNPALAPHLPAFWDRFQEGYGRDLGDTALFRVLEIQALIRLSPRTRKHKVVVPRIREPSAAGRAPVGHAMIVFDALYRRKLAELSEVLHAEA